MRRGDLDKSRGVKVGANSSDIAFFSLWFNLINYCFSGVSVITNPEKANDQHTGIADASKHNIGTADLEEADGVEADGADAEKAEESNTGTADITEVDGVEVDGVVADRTEANGAEANGTDKPNTGPANLADPIKTDGADKQGKPS